MKRKLLFVICLCLNIMTFGQIDFSVQTNGAMASFTLTKQGNFYESIKWDFGDGNTSQGTNSTISHTYTTLGNYTVCVIGSPMPMATNDTMCKSISIMICPWLAPTINGVTFCENDKNLSLTPLEASIPTQNPQPKNVVWEWYSDAGLTTKIASTSNSSYTPNNIESQSFYVRYSDVEPMSNVVCWSPASKVTRTVNPKPYPQFASSVKSDYCYNDNTGLIVLEGSDSKALPGTDVFKVTKNGVTKKITVISIGTPTADEIFSIEYVRTTESGCTDSVHKDITVHYIATPIVISPNPKTIVVDVANNISEPTNLSAMGTGNNEIQWMDATCTTVHSTGNTLVTGLNGTDLGAAPSKSFLYKVRQMESVSGCVSNCVDQELILTMCPALAPTVVDPYYCVNDPLELKAIAIPQGTQGLGDKLVWYPTSTISGSPISGFDGVNVYTSSIAKTAPITETVYVVQYNKQYNCYSNPKKVTITINPKPSPQFASSVKSDYCYNDNTGLIVLDGSDSKALPGTDLFKVSEAGVTTKSSVISIGTATNDISYDIEYVRTTDKQCKDSVKKTITVHYVPAPQVLTSAPTKILFGNSIPSATATLTASSLQWYDIDGITPIPAPAGTASTYTYSGPAPVTSMVYPYKVLQIDNYGCKSAMTDAPLIFEICLAKSPIVLVKSICIYDTIPSFTITRTTTNSHKYEFEVYDMSPYSYPSQAKKLATISAGQVFTPVIPTVNAQIYKYWVAEHDIDDDCTGQGTEFSLTVNEIKEPAVKVNTSICKNTKMNVTLSVIPITGADVYWYDKNANTKEEALNSTFINKGNPFLLLGINALPKGTYTYYASQIVSGCQSAKSAVTFSIVDPSEESVSVTINKGDSTLIGSIYYKIADTIDIHYNNELVCDSLVHYFISVKIIGDTNNNGIIDETEIAGDIDGDGKINNGEICGDVNGNKVIDATEIAGDINGNGVIDNLETKGKAGFRNEIAGDLNGDGEITAPEITGDINGNGIIDSKSETLGDINGNGTIDPNETTDIAILGKTNITVYPSPTKSMIYIKTNKNTIINKVEICSILGNIVQDGNYNSESKSVSIQSLPTGLYIVKIYTEGKMFSQKVIKE